MATATLSDSLVWASAGKGGKKVSVSGWVSRGDYLKMILGYDLLALPSYSETFGMSLVEAMGQGLPVISTFSGGVPYVVRDGEDGILFEAGDLSALQTALERLVNDRNLRVAMGKTAWKDASERFSGRIVLQGLESVYSQLQ